MAAGLGSRMGSLTCDIPKPMIKINNKELISTLIDALYFNGINDILVVGGYKFERLREFLSGKYPKVKIIENKYYNVANNISSIYVAKDYLNTDVLICESDLFVSNKNVFEQEFTKSGYFSFFKKGEVRDWCFEVSKGRINKIKRSGYDNYMMTGVSYFNKRDAEVLRRAITDAFEKKKNDLYWDEVVDSRLNEIDMKSYQISGGDLVELDTPQDIEMLLNKINRRK